jgi:mRNA-degrading endonuclease toxin of MazEF toxin-antitoxin module
MAMLSRIRHYFFPSLRHSCPKPSRELKPQRSFSQGDIIRGLANRFAGKHVIDQKMGCRFNVIVSSSQASKETENFILAPLRGLKLGEKIYPHETVINPDGINRLFKKSIVVGSQLFTVPQEALNRSFKLGNILGPDLEKIKAGARIAIDPILRDIKKKSAFKRGDIIRIEKEGEISKGVVISNDLSNAYSPLLMVATLSEEKNIRNRFETVVITNNLRAIRVKSHEIQTLDQGYVTKKIGTISEVEMLKITTKIHQGIGLKV